MPKLQQHAHLDASQFFTEHCLDNLISSLPSACIQLMFGAQTT